VPTLLLPCVARSLAYGLGLPHAGGGPTIYRTQYSTYLIESLCQVLPELCTLAQFFCHDTHTQNGVTESKHHYILETARVLMLASFIPPHFWVEVVPTITYLINIQPSSTL
jgi:hypothetical protein